MAACGQLHANIHNFGIYKKNGKRAILQLDFPGECIYLIQRGHIKKTHSFEHLQHFDSEEGLHIVLKFRDNEMEFDADNMEEKYTLCRLISLVLDNDDNDEYSKDDVYGVPMSASKAIKEAVVEKKGNTTITTWNKRRLKVTPGEFSYYKPGEDLALNIVQIWQGICSVKRYGQHGFTVTVRSRVYSFRILNDRDKGHNPEVEREEWIEAFHISMRSKRNTYLFLAKTPTASSTHGSTSCDTPIDGEESSTGADDGSAYETVEVNNNEEPQSVTSRKKHASVHLSYVGETIPLQKLPTARRPKPPAFNKQDCKPVPETNHSETDTLRKSDGDSQCDDGNDLAAIRLKWQSMDENSARQSAGVVDKDNATTCCDVPLYASVVKCKPTTTMEVSIDFPEADPEPEPDYAMDVFNDPVESESLPQQRFPHNKRSSSASAEVSKARARSSENITDDQKNKSRPLPVSPEPRVAPAAPAVPPAPPRAPLSPPPHLVVKKSGVKLSVVPKMRLKQLFWSKVPQNMVSSTMWKGSHDVTARLDLKSLENLFALQEKDYANIQPQASIQKKTNKILLDAKRATNLSIMFNGPKPDVAENLKVALNSITEMEAFPVDKLSTLRRYQPTADDMEMYRMYRSARHDLHAVDRFMVDLCSIPDLDTRLSLIITILEFPSQVKELAENVSDLVLACEELTKNSDLSSVLEYVLAIGNYMNAKWNSGLGAYGFQITSIEKVVDMKSRNPQYSLLHYLVEQIALTNPQLLEWTSGVKHVQKCADLSIKAVGAEVEVLKNGIVKIKRNLKSVRHNISNPCKQEKKFLSDVQNFITEYDMKLEKLCVRCSHVDKRYLSILGYFGEMSTRTSDGLFSSVALFADKFQTVKEKRAS